MARHPLLGYLLATFAIGLALPINLLLDPIVGTSAPYLVFSVAIVLAAWLGGLGPGLLATLLATVLSAWFFIPPADAFLPMSGDDQIRLAFFAIAGILVSLLSSAFHAARRQFEESSAAARARAEELTAVVESIDEAVILFDPRGRVVLANRAAGGLMGSLAGASFATVLGRFEEPNGPLPIFRWPSASEPVEARLGEEDRWLEIRGFPAAGSTLLVLRDVTGDRRTNEIRDAFIGILSHELRTPITTIYGGSKILARPTLPDAARRELGEDIESEADRLHRLVEDLLVLAKVERTGLEIGNDPVQVQHLVSNVVEAETVRLVNRTIRMTVAPGLPTASGDATYVEQVTRNLIGNAAKYGTPGTPIEVIVEATPADVLIRVRDQGPGVEAEDAPHLFDLFYRSSRVRGISGAGIGLFVCRQLARAMDGDVSYERTADGSQFTVSLPRYTDDVDEDEDGVGPAVVTEAAEPDAAETAETEPTPPGGQIPVA